MRRMDFDNDGVISFNDLTMFLAPPEPRVTAPGYDGTPLRTKNHDPARKNSTDSSSKLSSSKKAK
jgi:hypothetical protein